MKLTDTQRASFDEFKAASIKSAEMMRNACQADVPDTIVGRTEPMEKRMDTMLQSVRTMRPALEAFYATLSDEQKKQLDSSSGPGRFWLARSLVVRSAAPALLAIDLSQRPQTTLRYG